MTGFFDLLDQITNASTAKSAPVKAGFESPFGAAVQGPTAALTSPTDPLATRAHATDLRNALAVRHWVDPDLLLPSSLTENERHAVLDAVAPDVETSWRQHPGEWCLRDIVRRDVLTTLSLDASRAVLDSDSIPSDAVDPVRTALRMRREPLSDSLATMASPVLIALQTSLSWLAPRDTLSESQLDKTEFWYREPDARGLRERIAAILERRRRDADVARMSQTDLFDRQILVDKLIDLATRPRGEDGAQGQWIYLSGIGGSGKSTLFAHLEHALSTLRSPLLVVHLDCDEPGFDPTDVIALDISLFRQLGVAVPAEAPRLRERVSALAAVAEGANEGYTSRLSAKRSSTSTRNVKIKAVLSPHAVQSFEGLEMAVTERSSGRTSISWDALLNLSGDQPLVLLIDTAELIFARGQDATEVFASWAASLVQIMGAPDLRLIVAGRDPPDAPGPRGLEDAMAEQRSDADRPQSARWLEDPALVIRDLSKEHAAAMLKGLGVDDPGLCAKAARILPGTPLVLRLAAEAYTSGGEARKAFASAVGDEEIDPAVARRYLTERVVRHMAATVARPYVLGAMVLPEVTQQLVADVVMPAVLDGQIGRETPSDVYEGIAAAGWLVRATGDGKRLIFHTEVRRLTLELLEADQDSRVLVQRVREKARDFFSTRRGPINRTFFAYFDALLGGTSGGDRRETLTPAVLGAAIEDLRDIGVLSDTVRERVFGGAPMVAPSAVSVTTARAGTYQATETDQEWRARLEGSGNRNGEGDRLVKRNRAADALRLYRARPTRPPGLPPTFVLQALADNAEWETGEVDTEAVLTEHLNNPTSKSGPGVNAIRSRLYWLTRYELLRSPTGLSERHMDVLRDASESTSGRGPVLLFPGVLAVAEALRPGKRSEAPEGWFAARGAIESQTRLFLVEHLHFGRSISWQPHVDALLVTQPDWPERARAILSRMEPPLITKGKGRGELSQIDDVAAFFRKNPEGTLDLPGLNTWLRTLRRPVSVTIDQQTAQGDAILLLRGLTTEVHRPLRAAIARLVVAEPAMRSELEAIVYRCVEGFGVQPREFSAGELNARIERDLSGLFAIVIPYADRSRRLPNLCRDLLPLGSATSSASAVTRVARAFLNWDMAICAGGDSAYSVISAQSLVRS
jgi:hypothetical protein